MKINSGMETRKEFFKDADFLLYFCTNFSSLFFIEFFLIYLDSILALIAVKNECILGGKNKSWLIKEIYCTHFISH